MCHSVCFYLIKYLSYLNGCGLQKNRQWKVVSVDLGRESVIAVKSRAGFWINVRKIRLIVISLEKTVLGRRTFSKMAERLLIMLKLLVIYVDVMKLKHDHNDLNVCSFWVKIILFITIIAWYLVKNSGYLAIFGGYLEIFWRISGNMFRPFYEIFASKRDVPAGVQDESVERVGRGKAGWQVCPINL